MRSGLPTGVHMNRDKALAFQSPLTSRINLSSLFLKTFISSDTSTSSGGVTNYRTGPIGAIGPTGAIPVPYRRYKRYTRTLPALQALYQSPIGAIPEPYRRYAKD